MDPSLSRLRVAYRKRDRLAYLGHLEVLRTLERSVRRSGLPFDVSSGFARRMRLQFSQALPVGAASEGEYFDVGLTRRVDPVEALDALVSSTPSQLAPFACAYVPTFLPSLEAWLDRASWSVTLEVTGVDATDLDRALVEVADAGSISFLRGTKPRVVELASTLVGWEAVDVAPGAVRLSLETRSSSGGALRPAVLLDAAFARDALASARREATRVTRTAQRHESDDGDLMDAFDVSVSKVCTL